MEETAATYKNLGNVSFGEKKYEDAIEYYDSAVEWTPENHILYSNRSAAHFELGKYEEAVQDAEKCLFLNSNFAKGYSRKGNALFCLNELKEAREAFIKGLKIEPENEPLKNGLENCDKKLLNIRTSKIQEKPPGKFYFGVHDYWDMHKWINIWHFHEIYEDMFTLGKTDHRDGFGMSGIFGVSGISNPDHEYESFRYGGEIHCNRIPENIVKKGRANRSEVERFASLHNGSLTET